MWLVRCDSSQFRKEDEIPDDHSQRSFYIEEVDEYEEPENAELKVIFERFGRGAKRKSKFEVHIGWDDMRLLLRKFIELKNPEAMHLQEMIELAKTAMQIGDPPTDEFWEMLPQSN